MWDIYKVIPTGEMLVCSGFKSYAEAMTYVHTVLTAGYDMRNAAKELYIVRPRAS